eukprot:SAG22_NODE_11805_length_468_cov_1.249322_1_plen_155_part_11
MSRLQDTGAVYTLGQQPGSSIHHNHLLTQVLTGLEPRPACEATPGQRCSITQVMALEGGHCPATAFCNVPGGHGGGFYPDAGSRGFDIHSNVAEQVYNWLFIWSPTDMHDIAVHDCFSDSPINTNMGGNNNCTFSANTFVNRGAGEHWPDAAAAI